MLSEDGQKGGKWAVTADGNRLGAPWNIHGETPLENIINDRFSGNSAERSNIEGKRGDVEGGRGNIEAGRANIESERGKIEGDRGNLNAGDRGSVASEAPNKFIRLAGVGVYKELEENEAYILAYKPAAKQREFFLKTLDSVSKRLSADSGITVITPADFEENTAYLIPSGGCAECANQRQITHKVVQAEVIKSTGIRLNLPEEVHRYSDIVEDRINKGELTSGLRTILSAIKNFHEATGSFEVASGMAKVAKESLNNVDQQIFLNHLSKNYGDFGKKLVTAIFKPDLSQITGAETPEVKKQIEK